MGFLDKNKPYSVSSLPLSSVRSAKKWEGQGMGPDY